MGIELEVISVATLIAVTLAGLSMGVYIAVANKFRACTPSPISLLVLGWSFLVPLGVEQSFEGDIHPSRLVERLILWAVFSGMTSIASRLSKEYYWSRKNGEKK